MIADAPPRATGAHLPTARPPDIISRCWEWTDDRGQWCEACVWLDAQAMAMPRRKTADEYAAELREAATSLLAGGPT